MVKVVEMVKELPIIEIARRGRRIGYDGDGDDDTNDHDDHEYDDDK